MARDISSSSSSKSSSPTVSQKDLLNFYQRKYEEHQRKEDKYKEKIDKHLKNLVTDRHELEEEVLRRGEKIADLQKALVALQLSVFEEREKFLHVAAENEELKRHEEELHESIRQLLAVTQPQELRDRIIYILKDPKVDVVSRTGVSSKSRSVIEVTVHQKLKEELDSLRHQLNEVLEASKNKEDVVLKDCKEALEKAKTKIVQGDIQIKKLEKILQEKNKTSFAAAKSSVRGSATNSKSSFSERPPITLRDTSWETLGPASTAENVFIEKQNLPERFATVDKSISAERQSSLTIPKTSFAERFHSAGATENAFVERQRFVPTISAERQISPTATKDVFHEALNSGEVTSVERQRYVPIGKSISSQRQSSLTTTKDFSSRETLRKTVAERLKTTKAAKSISWENQQADTISRDISRESRTTVQSSEAASKSTSAERLKSAKVAKSISWENRLAETAPKSTSGASGTSSLAATKSTSAEKLQSTKAAKSLSWENQQPKNTFREKESTVPSSVAATQNTFAEKQRSAESISCKKQPSVILTKSISEYERTTQSSVDAEVWSKLCSLLKDIHLSLILLMKVISKIKSVLNSMQATQLYHRIARIPRTPVHLQRSVEENTILQLETSLRQCTRLTFDINNIYKSACKEVTLHKNKIENINELKSEMKYLESLAKEFSMIAADNDLLNVGLRRSDFYQALKDSSVVISEENRLHFLEDFKTIVSNCETLSQTVSETADFVGSVIEKYDVKKNFNDNEDSLQSFPHLSSKTHSDIQQEPSNSDEHLKKNNGESFQDLKKLVGVYENFGLATERLLRRMNAAEKIQDSSRKCDDHFDEAIMGPETEEPDPVPSDCEEIVRKIDKVLYKVRLIEEGRYSVDEAMCRKLAENINALTEKFKELTQEFNVKSVQHQFSEYSKVTLSKLEELAKQCKNSVVAAESQIAAHRSNAKNLSEKLKETEELLRESIHECLSLKQKIKQMDAEHEMEKYKMISTLKEKLEHHTSEGVGEVVDELVSNFPAYETIRSTPFICMYCRHGPGHKYCEEKIKELTAECRKFKTQLKLLKQETDQERQTLRHHREVAESSMTDLTRKNQSMKDSLETLEKNNASLLEQLKLERNRLKNMERFRRLEMEGFQTDIKQLKGKIKDLEKQLLKAVFVFESNHKDIELLKTVHETAQRSEQATAILRRLKAKLYQLENDLKSL